MNAATETMPPAAPRTAPVKATWVCLAIAWLTFLLPIPGIGLFIGWPLNLVAFILAIVVMSRGYTTKGLIPLISSLVVSPIVYFIGVAILAGTAAAGGELQKAASEASTPAVEAASTSESAPPAPAAIQISARDLFAAYDANEVAADGQYKGKQLEVTGAVESINKDFTDGVYVALEGGEMFDTLQAHDLDAQQAAALSKGQNVTLLCEGNGMVMGSPMLKDCKLL
jgi:hypothetical protein